jgi:hypothetical protein
MHLFNRSTAMSFLAGASLVLGACSTTDGGDGSLCEGGKCDDPGQAADRQCEKDCEGKEASCVQECRDAAALGHCAARRSDALESAQKAFTRDAIRWACSDVEGVNTNFNDDRGQEYCEYYAVVQPPPESEGGELPRALDLGRNREGRPATEPGMQLVDDQIFALEDNPDAVVGQCVFTTWHADVDVRYPVCNGSDVTCPKLSFAEGANLPPWQADPEFKDVRLTSEYMQMKVGFNSNGAAADLVEKCLSEPPAGDPANADDPLHDDFTRGCWKAYELFRTEWRRSDTAVCASGIRLAECGCGVDTDGDGTADITDPIEVSRAVVPRQPGTDGSLELRGFHLGTWSGADALPAGCRYIETGDAGAARTLVTCDLTASDVLASQSDVKQKCREKYGDNVVVHVPVPAEAIVCTPPADGQYAADCSSMPWVLQ